jgi:opine dehydrogenase
MSRLARQVGVEVPTMNAIIQLTSVLMAQDYAGESLRTPDSLGIGAYSAGELGKL